MSELKHLHSAWDVDRFIVLEDEKVVAVRFSDHETPQGPEGTDQHDHHMATALMDEALVQAAPLLVRCCTVYAVDTKAVPEFNRMYELGAVNPQDPFGLLFFFRNQHIKVDLGTGNTNKVNFPMARDDFIDVVQTVFVAAKEGKHIVSSGKKFSHVSMRR